LVITDARNCGKKKKDKKGEGMLIREVKEGKERKTTNEIVVKMIAVAEKHFEWNHIPRS
jgi:hypothetical protein